uniref:Uncharacterized protein n=1 Tax=Triticum urartu TaxID=4572 RepID=A0A8R7U016_TRIUA
DVLGDAAGRPVARLVGLVVGVPPVLGRVVLLAVAPERVGLLAVHRVVADHELLLRHPQRHDEPDDEADDAGDHHVPSDDEERAHHLLQELHAAAAAAVEGAARVGHRHEHAAQRRLREEPRGHAAEEPRHGVGVEHAQRVVHALQQLGPLVHDHHGEPRDAAGEDPHHDRRPPLDQTRAGRDADEAGDHALDGADDGGLLEEDDVQGGPDEEAGRGADVGVEHCDGGVEVGGVRVTAVEPGPPHPEDAGAGEHEEHVVGREPLPVLGGPGPDPVRGGESGDPGGEVDDVAAGVVHDAPLEEEASAPEREGADGVGEGEPERDEDHPGPDVHAAQQRAGEEDERDGGEDALEVDHGGHGVIRIDPGRLLAAVLEEVGGLRQHGLHEEELLPERRPGLAPEGGAAGGRRTCCSPR